MSPEEKAPAAPKSRITLPRGVNIWWNVKKRLWRVGWRDDAGKQQFEHFRLKAAAEERAREVAELVLARGREALRATGFADARHWGRVKAALGTATLDQLLSVWERHKHEVIVHGHRHAEVQCRVGLGISLEDGSCALAGGIGVREVVGVLVNG